MVKIELFRNVQRSDIFYGSCRNSEESKKVKYVSLAFWENNCWGLSKAKRKETNQRRKVEVPLLFVKYERV